MNKRLLAIALMPIMLSVGSVNAEDQEYEKKLMMEGKQLMKSFASELKASLQAAIKEGGLPKGIEACSIKASEISSANSQGGWEVARTSLKPRNPGNAPDSEQEKVLRSFERSLQEGKSISDLVAVIKDEKSFHMMKAIPTKGLCLSCHGSDLSEEVKAALASKYPEDKAIGYKEGEIRGAFSLVYRAE